MRTVTLEELLEAGCHFGHQVTRSNPKAREFIYEARDGIHIIDLAKTKQGLEEAAAFIKSLASQGGSLIVVGTKRQARGVVEEILKSIRQAQGEQVQDNKLGDRIFYVTNRWVGGLLTNFSEVAKNFEKLKTLTENLKNEELKTKYTKKEVGHWEKERQKLESIYGGVAALKEKPDAIFVIDSHLENLAVKEARRMGVTTVAIVDTNADPDMVDYPIPANDDAVGSIKLITDYIVGVWVEGRKNSESVKNVESKKKESSSKKESKKTKSDKSLSAEKGKKSKSKSTRTKNNS